MGPTNISLVTLFEADQKLRAAVERLDAATHSVRIQERRVHDLDEKLRLARQRLKEQQSQAAQLDLDVKSRDGKIERLRSQQQSARTHKEYQAFLVEINTEKVDRTKSEELALRTLEEMEQTQGEIRDMAAALETERAKAQTMKDQMGDTVARLQADIDALQPVRDAAAEAVPPQARQAFERLAERFEGEALSAIGRPDRRREEYMCTACNMDLVTDVYNRLHTRNDLVFCPSCRRILYIPEDLTPDQAVKQKPERRESKPRNSRSPRRSSKRALTSAPAAAIGRQTSAADVLASMQPESGAPQPPEQPQPVDPLPAEEQPPAAEQSLAAEQPLASQQPQVEEQVGEQQQPPEDQSGPPEDQPGVSAADSLGVRPSKQAQNSHA